MAMPASEIKTLIEDAIPGAHVEIKDLAGDNDHFAAYVTSDAFRGKTRVQQHQMVYQALGTRMGGELHALAVYTTVPE
ncbi:BolA family protein [Candidatus Paracaedibacter symbiosus]|uniref:BolA family protein n=1 Tax=Candidatus Paracaedibacter symbiosus TaxID=244582 RepID=UPI000509445C|nr:BolA family transcriptional regulator [Candidatus Paracaedibacter symbiosus]